MAATEGREVEWAVVVVIMGLRRSNGGSGTLGADAARSKREPPSARSAQLAVTRIKVARAASTVEEPRPRPAT